MLWASRGRAPDAHGFLLRGLRLHERIVGLLILDAFTLQYQGLLIGIPLGHSRVLPDHRTSLVLRVDVFLFLGSISTITLDDGADKLSDGSVPLLIIGRSSHPIGIHMNGRPR